MPRMGFEITIPAFERAKTFHALDRATTVTDKLRTVPWRIMGSGGIAVPFLTSALDVGEWSVSRPEIGNLVPILQEAGRALEPA
jgi:hypothetical protein